MMIKAYAQNWVTFEEGYTGLQSSSLFANTGLLSDNWMGV